MYEFDNRRGLRRLSLSIPQLLNNTKNSGMPHFVFEIGGKKIAYCYIRKNGCTAFKNLLVHCSRYAVDIDPMRNPIHFFLKHHRVDSLADFQACHDRIFVYRCPLDRAASLYINKFVVQKSSADIFQNFRALTGVDPNLTTFRDFVMDYLSNHRWRSLDVHTYPQMRHLKPITYTAAIPIEDLLEDMTNIIGHDLATRFFANRVNASKSDKRLDEDCSRTPVAELHSAYLREGVLPSVKSLLAPDIAKRLSDIYDIDVSLIRNIKRSNLGKHKNIPAKD